MNILVLSSRSAPKQLADVCAYDFEDAIVDGAGADLHLIGGDRSTLKPGYDLLIVCGISFRAVADLVRRIEAEGPLPAADRRVAYVFGAYGSAVDKRRRPVRRIARWLTGNWPARLRLFDRIYLGIPYDAAAIETALGVPTRYLPMAANVLPLQARPFDRREDRPIAVSAFGRQHDGIMNAILDRLNRPDSCELACRITPWQGCRNELPRYRAMFWQMLRMSRVSLAFDHFFANPSGRAEHSYIGPRWFEILAAGAVVAGRGPSAPEARALLDWPDALVDLDSDPRIAAEEIAALSADDERLRTASCRNLAEMHASHDWRHRLASLLETERLDRPARLREQLHLLETRAATLRTARAEDARRVAASASQPAA